HHFYKFDQSLVIVYFLFITRLYLNYTIFSYTTLFRSWLFYCLRLLWLHVKTVQKNIHPQPRLLKGKKAFRKKIGIPKMMQMHYWTKNRKWLKLKRIMSRIESSQHLMEIHAHKWVLIGIRQMNLMMHKYG